MKIRAGFVSNSSSSSFIVGVPTFKDTTIEGRISELYEVAKEYEYEIDELPYLRGWNLEKVKELAEKGYTFEYLDVPFGCEDTVYNFLNKIGAVTVVDFGGQDTSMKIDHGYQCGSDIKTNFIGTCILIGVLTIIYWLFG